MTSSAMADAGEWLHITMVKPVRQEHRGQTLFADFGNAAFGNLELSFATDPGPAEITVRLGEKITTGGTIDRKPPGSVIHREVRLRTFSGQRTYRLVLPGVKRHEDPGAVHMPKRIGEVTPFRFAELDGPADIIKAVSLRQLFVHAPFDDHAASFECSDQTLNAVWNLCHHTMKATTAFGIYIDGERERIPYEADAYLNQLSHYACDLDPRLARITFEHLLKHPTWPIEWSLHMPLIAAADYEATGNPVLAQTHYEGLKKKLLEDRAREDGLLRAYAIVDWPPVERDLYNDGKTPPSTTHPQSQTVGPEVNTVVNAFYYHALRRMVPLAKATGHDADADRFDQLAKRVADSFQRVFFDRERRVYTDGEGSRHASLHANMFALAFDLVPVERRQAVVDFIKSRGMACSVYGAQYLLDGLFNAGEDDYAVGLMAARTPRSWWHMIELGSTMTLEAWDAKTKPNLTWNHAWGAVPANIIARHVLGVRPLSPGYQSILIAPQTGSLQWLRGKVPTPHGPVLVDIDQTKGYRLELTIPTGTTGRVVLPRKAAEDFLLDGMAGPDETTARYVTFNRLQPGRHIIAVPAK